MKGMEWNCIARCSSCKAFTPRGMKQDQMARHTKPVRLLSTSITWSWIQTLWVLEAYMNQDILMPDVEYQLIGKRKVAPWSRCMNLRGNSLRKPFFITLIPADPRLSHSWSAVSMSHLPCIWDLLLDSLMTFIRYCHDSSSRSGHNQIED